MATITLKGNAFETVGELPGIDTKAPSFTLTGKDLSDSTLQDYSGKPLVLNIFPSIDTPVCAASVRRFNKEASEIGDTVVLCISADLPFAHSRFCEVEGLNDVVPLSNFRAPGFGKDYGETGPLAGLLSRAIVVIDGSGVVRYTEQVPEIGQEPDYGVALKTVSELS